MKVTFYRSLFLAMAIVFAILTFNVASHTSTVTFEDLGLPEGSFVTSIPGEPIISLSGAVLILPDYPITGFNGNSSGFGPGGVDNANSGATISGVVDTTSCGQACQSETVTVTFAKPVKDLTFYTVDIEVATVTEVFTARAYDSEIGGNLLTSVQLTGGDPDTGDGLLTLVDFPGTDQIRRLEFEALTTTSPTSIPGYAVDNISFTVVDVTDGTLWPAGGTVLDDIYGEQAQISMPSGVLTELTEVAIHVFESPLDILPPSGFTGPGTHFVDVLFNPEPTFPLPVPGATVVLPLDPMVSGRPLDLFRIDPTTGELVPAEGVDWSPVIGVVNDDELSVTFTGVTHLSTIVGLTPEDPCDSEPCQNGGVCNPDGAGGYVCSCAPPWTGDNCEIVINPCDPNPCQNDGMCLPNRDGSYVCECALGWTGDNCEIVINPCDPNPCQNGGVCNPDGAGGYVCSCTPPWTGDNCEIVINPCDSEPCQNDGVCLPNRDGSYVCECALGWTGDNCEIPEEPASIKDLLARAKSSKVSLKWTPIQDAVGYNIYRRLTVDDPYELIMGNYVTDYAAYTDYEVSNGTTYHYVVRWVHAGGWESPDSNEVNATPASRR